MTFVRRLSGHLFASMTYSHTSNKSHDLSNISLEDRGFEISRRQEER
jgi:hypothetical protein